METWGRRGALVLALHLGGCAVMFSKSLSPHHEVSVAPSCSTGGVGLDVAFALGYGALALAALSNDSPGLSVAGLVGTGIHALSARAALGDRDQCDEARERHAAYIKNRERKLRRLTQELGKKSALASRDSLSAVTEALDASEAEGNETSHELRLASEAGKAEADTGRADAGRAEAKTDPSADPAAPLEPWKSDADWRVFWIEVTP